MSERANPSGVGPGLWSTDARWLWLLLLAVFLRALTPIFFKTAALSLDEFALLDIATNLFYWLSLLALFLRAFVWQAVLHHVPLSVAYPFTSFSFVFLLLVAHFQFGEAVQLSHLIGTGLIIAGSLLVAGGRGGSRA